jgi:hypothetical protein
VWLPGGLTYATTPDDRLPRAAIDSFNRSRKSSGLTQSCFPSREISIIPPFSLWWVSMVHDFMMWRGEREFLAAQAPGVRAVLDYFVVRLLPSEGLLSPPAGWNFVDWVPTWDTSGGPRLGEPPMVRKQPSGILNWQLVMTLRQAADIEEFLGEGELAARDRRIAGTVQEATIRAFWDAGRGLYADDLAHEHFSEHCQCMAILSGGLDAQSQTQLVEAMTGHRDLAQATIYFSHYLFEAFRQAGRMEMMLTRMGPWFDALANGCFTTLESPEPTRSDCHAWGAHPVFHFLASVLGVRPAAPGFGRVTICPQLGSLEFARGAMSHPLGLVKVDLTRRSGRPSGTIELPPGLEGEIVIAGRSAPLSPGKQSV